MKKYILKYKVVRYIIAFTTLLTTFNIIIYIAYKLILQALKMDKINLFILISGLMVAGFVMFGGWLVSENNKINN